MKRVFLSVVVLLTSIPFYGQQDIVALSIVEKTFQALNDLDRISYTYSRRSEANGMSVAEKEQFFYFDFTTEIRNETPKYFISSDNSQLHYNGKQQLQLLKKEELILYIDNPDPNNPILLSVYSIRRFLKEVLNYENIEVKLLANEIRNNSLAIEIIIEGATFDWIGLEIKPTQQNLVSKYQIVIDDKTFMPLEMKMENGPMGYLIGNYSNYNSTYTLDESDLNGENLPSLPRISFAEYYKGLQDGSFSVDYGSQSTAISDEDLKSLSLPQLFSKDSIQPFNAKEIVLLKFWFRYCAACVKAIPSINSLNKDYSDLGLKVYGVEFYERKPSIEVLEEYIERTRMQYANLYAGYQLAGFLKVKAAPTIVILDKEGNTLYSKIGYFEDEVKAILEEHL